MKNADVTHLLTIAPQQLLQCTCGVPMDQAAVSLTPAATAALADVEQRCAQLSALCAEREALEAQLKVDPDDADCSLRLAKLSVREVQLVTKKDARQCPHCGFGPLELLKCDDLKAHHGEWKRSNNGALLITDNACPRCHHFAANIAAFPVWDGRVMTTSEECCVTASWSEEVQRKVESVQEVLAIVGASHARALLHRYGDSVEVAVQSVLNGVDRPPSDFGRRMNWEFDEHPHFEHRRLYELGRAYSELRGAQDHIRHRQYSCEGERHAVDSICREAQKELNSAHAELKRIQHSSGRHSAQAAYLSERLAHELNKLRSVEPVLRHWQSSLEESDRMQKHAQCEFNRLEAELHRTRQVLERSQHSGQYQQEEMDRTQNEQLRLVVEMRRTQQERQSFRDDLQGRTMDCAQLHQSLLRVQHELESLAQADDNAVTQPHAGPTVDTTATV